MRGREHGCLYAGGRCEAHMTMLLPLYEITYEALSLSGLPRANPKQQLCFSRTARPSSA